MNASSTHDTKRAEDARARINVLSEIPQEWQNRLTHWASLNEKHKALRNGTAVPDRNEEYFLYQTLLGMWPLQEEEVFGVLERLQSYAVKATREAMVHTRWTRPNLAHEEGLTRFVASILNEKENREFLDDFRGFHRRLAFYGMLNGLSQTLLKITAPGVPDFYQGSELWDLRLVDPDNRGPIDFERRIALLQGLQREAISRTGGLAAQLWESWADGTIKLYVIWKALQLRQKWNGLFTDGDFCPRKCRANARRTSPPFFASVKMAPLLSLPRNGWQVPGWTRTPVRHGISGGVPSSACRPVCRVRGEARSPEQPLRANSTNHSKA